VYGGGSLGLMGSVSTTAFLGGNQVLGVVPKALTKLNIIEKTVAEELLVFSMSERMTIMLTMLTPYCLTKWSGHIREDISYFFLGPTEHSPKTYKFVKC